jgi:hypothetical protein
VKYDYTIWYWTGTTELAKLEIKGNITNLSELNLWDVRIEWTLIEGDKSEPVGHLVSLLPAGQMYMFHFDHEVPRGKYDYRWTILRYKGITQYKGTASTRTSLWTSTMTDVKERVGTTTVATTGTVLITYTETATPAAGLFSLSTLVIVAVAGMAVAALMVLWKRQRAPPTAVKPQADLQVAPPTGPAGIKLCPRCQTSNEATAKFCVNCGYKF